MALVLVTLIAGGAARPQGAAVSERGLGKRSSSETSVGPAMARESLGAQTRSETCRSATCQGGDARVAAARFLDSNLTERVTRPACGDARRGLAYYESRRRDWRTRMGAGKDVARSALGQGCPHVRFLAKRARARAHAARLAYLSWWHEQYAWWDWMPAKWRRIGACETGYGRQPGDFHWNSGPYQGAFGFAVASWDAFRLPGYPSEAYLATPRQQLNVALRIHARYGYSGWGCRNA